MNKRKQLPVYFLLCLFLGLPLKSAAFSSQQKYPWGHQVIPLFARLIPAGPQPGEGGFSVGMEWSSEESLPVTGESRKLFKIPAGLYENFGPHISVEAIGDIAQYHREAGNPFQWDIGDLRLSTTMTLMAQPALSIRFGVKLPNAPNNFDKAELARSGGLSGAGTDVADFFSSLLLSVPLGPCKLHGNYGFALLGDPTSLSSQLDLHTLACGLEYRADRLHFLAEGDWSFGPRDFDNYAAAAFSARYEMHRFFFGLRQGFGLNESEDDYCSSVYYGVKW
jgi:hypothetical protein